MGERFTQYVMDVASSAVEKLQRHTFDDPTELQGMTASMVRHATYQVRSQVVPGTLLGDLPSRLGGSAGAGSNQVAVRIIMDEEATVGGVEDTVPMTRARGHDVEVRIAGRLPLSMVILDAHCAIVAWRTEDRYSRPAAVIGQSTSLDVLIGSFETTWTLAHSPGAAPGPLGPRSVGIHLSADDHVVLELLAQGATDRAISGCVHMSERTVQRRIADLMARLGVATRFQIGVEAARRGWI